MKKNILKIGAVVFIVAMLLIPVSSVAVNVRDSDNAGMEGRSSDMPSNDALLKGIWFVRGIFKYIDEDEEDIHVKIISAKLRGFGNGAAMYRIYNYPVKFSKPFYGFLPSGSSPFFGVGVCREWNYVDDEEMKQPATEQFSDHKMCFDYHAEAEGYGTTWYVDDDGGADFTRIQDAIDAASDGDTIYVYGGTYHESINVSKSVVLTGENKETTIIDYNGTCNIVNISVDGVEISGFTVQKSGGYSSDSAIEILSNYSIISGNILSNTYYYPCYGVYITSARHNNVISGNTFLKSGLGFETKNLGQNTVTDNTVNGKSLVYLEGESDKVIDNDAGQVVLISCNNITIKNQEIAETTVGIHIVNSYNCQISNNDIHSNSKGIMIQNTDNCQMSYNNINSNNNGIYILGSDNCQMSNNTVHSNSNAICMDGTENGKILSNNLYANGICMMLYFSDINIIKRNNFDSNGVNVNSYFSSLNTWNGNYWDRPRLFPKLILEFPRINFDWYPAKEPYDITV